MRKVTILMLLGCLLLGNIAYAQKTSKVIVSFNAGELSPLMDARIDQAKYLAGCRTMENYIPLIYGGAQRRPGTEYIAGCKSNSDKSRLVAFEHSVDDTYILEFANQVIRVFRDGGQVLDGVGTETMITGNQVAHWKLNEIIGTAIDDAVGVVPYDGTASVDASTLTATGKVGTGCFDLDGQYDVSVSDAGGLSFTDNTDDEPFSGLCWAYIEKGDLQVLLSKWRNDNATREWRFSLNSDRKLQLHLADTSTNLAANRVAQWYLNDVAGDTHCDDVSTNHDGVIADGEFASTLTATGLTSMTPCYDFDGQYAVEVADAATLSFDDSGTNPFSIATWIYVTNTGASQIILAKHDWPGKREYAFGLHSDEKLFLTLYDESAGADVTVFTDAGIGIGWHFLVVTYDSVGGATAGTGVTLYVDKVAVDSTVTYTGTYVAMEADSAAVSIGAYYISAALTTFFQDKVDNVMLFDIELSQANISALYNSGAGTESLVGKEISAVSDAAVITGWHFLGFTYAADDNGSATAANGIILYVDGAAVNSTKTNDADYTAMQDGAEEVRIGSQRNSGDSAGENFWIDKIDEVSIYSDVLTPTEIASLYSTTSLEITSPYLTADLFELKFEQSADVMYVVHPDYEPRKLSRTEHTVWTLAALDIQTGPFRDQNTDTAKTIVADGTTGSVTLTAVGHLPFVAGTIAGHLPSGAVATSKSQTGALFKLVHATATSSVSEELEADTLNDATTTLSVPKGITWDFTTNGTWGAASDPASVVLERSYDSGTTYETLATVTSAANKNITTSGTEETADAIYRARTSSACAADTDCSAQLSVRNTSHIGIVEITGVTSSTVATGTVLKTLGATDLTHRWSEGSFSNYRGWPIDVTISAEERLTFVGSKSEPLTTWGSASGDFTDFALGSNDADAIQFSLIGTGQQNRIRWILSKDVLIIGTVGGEHLLGASKDDEALTPTNVRARLQTTHGSKDIAALLVNQAVLFIQRGGLKIREFLYSFETDAYNADDLTVFSNHITESGIVDMDYQRTPDPMLWCVRDDGEIAVMSYERKQNVFSWCRFVTSTNAGGSTTTDSDFESVAVIYGGAGNEDEVWVTVARVINSGTVRYVERFFQRAMPSDMDNMKYLDSFLTYDSTDANTITGLDHLEGETVQVLADGVVFDEAIVGGTPNYQITLKLDTVITDAGTVQIGLGYTSTLQPMKLDIGGTSLTTTKRINRAVVNLFETIQSEIGPSTSKLNTIATGISALYTGSKEVSLKGGYSREGDILIRQTDPLPSTILSLNLDVGIYGD